MRGRIRRRLALAIVVTALIPVCAAIWLSRSMIRQSSARFFQPEIGQKLTESLELYQELAAAVKGRMRANTQAMASGEELRAAVGARDPTRLHDALQTQLERYPDLVSVEVRDQDDAPIARADRGRAIDPETELQLAVTQPLPNESSLLVTFATARARFEQFEEMGRFVETYAQVERRRETDERTYVYAFAALLGITIALAIGVGTSLARGVSKRLLQLCDATEQVGAGDLRLRVCVSGNDEISDLARAFNHMLGEVETNRGRIEYLQQLATWQGMARRLAHEIKNPLTPIQLAVQEIHQRYGGDDPAYRQLVNTTLEVVEAEVGTLRRLVTEFSDFARLPKAKLSKDDLYAFLAGQRDQLAVQSELTPGQDAGVRTEFELPSGPPAPVRLDRQMFRRVLINLINNATRATQNQSDARIRVSAEPPRGRWLRLHVDDNGPGIPEALRPTIFDPYVTHTAGGTGLGLAIVKKIVVEHGGAIAAAASPLGGARITINLPLDVGLDESPLRATPELDATRPATDPV
jgi:two-component system, NtrC family, nitrogen regulation sensor histidine kinase NtrY